MSSKNDVKYSNITYDLNTIDIKRAFQIVNQNKSMHPF